MVIEPHRLGLSLETPLVQRGMVRGQLGLGGNGLPPPTLPGFTFSRVPVRLLLRCTDDNGSLGPHLSTKFRPLLHELSVHVVPNSTLTIIQPR